MNAKNNKKKRVKNDDNNNDNNESEAYLPPEGFHWEGSSPLCIMDDKGDKPLLISKYDLNSEKILITIKNKINAGEKIPEKKTYQYDCLETQETTFFDFFQ